MPEQQFPGTFTVKQTKQLLAPINPRRVLQAQGHSHVSQQDVTAHLIRVFGFGNFSTELLACELVFETPHDEAKRNDPKGRWTVCYRAVVRLAIFDVKHNFVTAYEDASMGDAQNQLREAGHDLAMKSAISTAKKRCAIHLGDQFGLSLYNKGQTDALVIGTHVLPPRFEDENPQQGGDLQANVPKQETLGIDEEDRPTRGGEADETAEKRIQDSLGGTPVEEEK